MQKLKSVQNHVKIKKLPSAMKEIVTRCLSPINAETCSNLSGSAISL